MKEIEMSDIDNENQNELSQKKKGMNLPNKLTLSRVIMIPVFMLFFYLPFKGHYIAAFAVFGIASFTDFLDGMIARKYNLITNFGKFMDPIADKVLVLTSFILFLTVPEVFTKNLGGWALIVAGCGVSIIAAREIIVSGFRLVAANSGYVIAADIFGKYKTVTQDFAIVFLLLSLCFYEFASGEGVVYNIYLYVNYIGLAFFALSVILTVISGINYLVKNAAVLK